jgi:peptidoglycan hydrolase-like protein with peptidoglycan-binding domain
MKKYIPVLLTLSLVLGFFTVYSKSASAANCAPGESFNTATGRPCSTIPQGGDCAPGDLFSSVNGQSCGVATPVIPRFCFLQNFQIGSRGEDIKTLQTELNAQGASLKVDGSYGPRTQASVQIYCKTYPTSSAVIISGIKGPQSLDVNQQGTWTVTAYNKEGVGDLSYSVSWGDEVYATPMMNSSRVLPGQQSATFTHSYSQPGIYKPVFTVTSENTIRCFTTPCPSNGGSTQTSLSVKVGNVNNSSITLSSPNGGEMWIKGTTQNINWQDNTSIFCPTNANCAAVPRYYDITLMQYYPPCTTTNTCNLGIARMAPYTIAKNVGGTSYPWSVGKFSNFFNNDATSNGVAPDGAYTIQICPAGSVNIICGSSDNYFNIVSGANQ